MRALWGGILAVGAGAEPISLHPENPHYFLYRGEPTVIITSGEHYGAVVNLDFDYRKYLDTLAAEGMNNTRIFSGAYVEPDGAFNIARNTLAPKPRRFIAPWARTETPGYAGGGAKFDLMRWDPAYFERLRDFMEHAEKRGVIVEMNLFCPFYEEMQWKLSPQHFQNNVNGVGGIARTNVYTLDRSEGLLAVHEALVEKLVTELNRFDNLYYEVCNEPYFGGVTLAWQHHIAERIVAVEKSLAKKHLISRNVDNGSARVDQPHPAFSIYNFHYANPPDAVLLNYDLNKVIGDNETGFRGTNDLPYRVEAWSFLLAGGALYNNLDYSFAVGHEDGTFVYPATQPGGGNPKFRAQLKALRDFLRGFDFIRMSPAPHLVQGGLPPGSRAYGLAKPGEAYALYLGPAAEIKDQFSARWTGEIEAPSAEEITFYTLSNDGVRLWIGDRLLIDNWTTHSATENSAKMRLEPGRRYPLKLEYFQSGGNAVMKLFWESSGQKRQIVPQSALFLPTGGPGLQGEYFGRADLQEPRMNRADLAIDFDWSQSSPFSSASRAVGERRVAELSLDLLPGAYVAEWLNPVTGKVVGRHKFRAGAKATLLTTPAYEEDLALAIRKDREIP